MHHEPGATNCNKSMTHGHRCLCNCLWYFTFKQMIPLTHVTNASPSQPDSIVLCAMIVRRAESCSCNQMFIARRSLNATHQRWTLWTCEFELLSLAPGCHVFLPFLLHVSHVPLFCSLFPLPHPSSSVMSVRERERQSCCVTYSFLFRPLTRSPVISPLFDYLRRRGRRRWS